MKLSMTEMRNKVLGCWMGKNIGGTLGAPFEWKRQVNDVTFYTQKLGGEPLPNDDLDIQLIWLVALEQRGIRLTEHDLAEYWCHYVTPHWVEYGTGKMNMRMGMPPPLSGDYHNDFRDSCGSYIRTEIWACIAPGDPLRAAQYAYMDSILDHGHGEGTWAALFTAALESAAFVISDLKELINIGLTYIPADCGVARVVRRVLECHEKGTDWREVREVILREFRGSTFLGWNCNISDEDRRKGYDKGKLGWDAPSNIGIYVLGLLYGGGDFEKMMCITVNCGEDTDCTAATAGSIWGIIHGFDKIPQKWIEPIGHGIKTVAINMGDIGWNIPKDVDNLTDRTMNIQRVVLHTGRRPLWVENGTEVLELGDTNPARFRCADQNSIAQGFPNGPTFRHGPLLVTFDYDTDAFVRPGQPKRLRVAIRNTDIIQLNLTLHWYLPEGVTVTGGPDALVSLMRSNIGTTAQKTLTFEFNFEKAPASKTRAVLELAAEGLPIVMLAPAIFFNGAHEQA